ncbi:MAG TPA: Ig-like domain-containing protein [Nevskiaceae bacterium]|nr:Ig-like domain-containing protein [Nevskiaceae bacterium]
MKKLSAWASVSLAMLLAACGDNGVRSPDFDAQLIDLIVDGPAQRAAGTQAQFRALGHFTTPPSTGGAVATDDITTAVDWRVVDVPANSSGSSPEVACSNANTVSNAATINDAGLLTALAPATVYVKAQQKGGSISGCRPFTITPGTSCTGSNCPPSTVVLQSIQVTPTTATIPSGTTQQYCARGVYSDSSTPREITDTTVSWTSQSGAVATVPAAPGNTGSCINATGVGVGTTNIVASATNSQSQTLTASGQINVTTATVKTVLRVEPPTATVVIGSGQQFVACGTFTDNTQDSTGPCSAHPTADRTETAGHAIANSNLNWTSGDNAIATVNANGLATGVAKGNTLITATLKDTVGDPSPASRSASAALTVTDQPFCQVALLAANGATVDVDKGSLCLACSVENPDNVIDAPPADPFSADETAARMNVSLSAVDLLGLGFINITVNSTDGHGNPVVLNPLATPANPGPPVGFFVGRPVADLLSAEVLAQTSIDTLRNGQVIAADHSSPGAGSDPLVLELLGTAIVGPGIGEDERILLHTTKTTAPFDAIRLTFSPSVASALATLDVFNACSIVQVPPPPPSTR